MYRGYKGLTQVKLTGWFDHQHDPSLTPPPPLLASWGGGGVTVLIPSPLVKGRGGGSLEGGVGGGPCVDRINDLRKQL